MADGKRSIIIRELITSLQFFVIAFIASAVAENALTSRQHSVDPVIDPNFDAINIKEMILSMWNGYYRWWFLVFVGLSAVRFLVLLFLSHRKES